MKFEWDEARNRANIRKHALDFADAEERFHGLLVVDPDTREDYDERRWIGVGSIRARIVYLVFTEPGPDTVRIISRERRAGVSANDTKRRSRTDWKRVDALRDSDIDFSEMPERGPDVFARAILWPGPKKQITLRLDPDVLAFFRKSGKGYQTTINAVLRKYVESRKGRKGQARKTIEGE